ncbi:CcdC family protein [Lentibacillus sediminis]|uniref:CcdC family protein n=1 Tax=Lentibacillus sediminis TaxID=1940529 RepID=UPI000C1BE1B5|nr:cytochrome c biogenesis protein CcdC [Lentibacillus sediminis]
MFWLVLSTTVAACMAAAMIVIRLRAAKKPASVKKIVLPPLFMSTGALMFVFPVFQINVIQLFEAAAVGLVCSFFLIKTSRIKIQEQEIYLVPSKWFGVILVGLLLFRVAFKLAIGSSISFGETSGMFFILAFSMIATWRIVMLLQYLQLEKQLKFKKMRQTN